MQENQGFIKHPDIVEAIKNTYGFFRQKYVVMSGRYVKTVSHYYKEKVIDSHLEGYYALAVFSGEKATRFISIDIDAGGKPAVRKVLDTFEDLGIPRDKMYVSTSGKKGYHVDMFFNPWIYNEKAKNLYELMIWRSGLDPKKVEFRPTFTQAVKIPLGVHASTKNRCWFLDRDTLEPIEDMEYIKTIELMDRDILVPILREWNRKRWNELYADMICNETGADHSIVKDIEFNDEYYESKALTKVGTRHDTMVEIAHDLRIYGANKFQIAKALRGFYFKQDPIMIESPETVVMEDIDDIAQWAEDNVPVLKYRKSPNEGKSRVIDLDKYDANAILHAGSKASRRIAFLIYSYCSMFGAAHLSHEYIAKVTGCSVTTVTSSIKKLIENQLIYRKSGGCHYKNGMMVRESNTYFASKRYPFGCPGDDDLISEHGRCAEMITKESFLFIYYRTLKWICTNEYLANYLTKTEMEELDILTA